MWFCPACGYRFLFDHERVETTWFFCRQCKVRLRPFESMEPQRHGRQWTIGDPKSEDEPVSKRFAGIEID